MESNDTYMGYLANAKNDPSKAEKTRKYNRAYQENYRKRKVRKEVIFSPSEFNRIKKSATKHKQSIAAHLRECVLAYLDKTIIVISEAQLQNIRYEIRRIGQNINQIAYKVNRDGAQNFDEFHFLNAIEELEKMIEVAASTPVDNETLIELSKASRLTLEEVKAILSCSSKP